jgi:hypothetical protein
MLSRNPLARPTVREVLDHPFISSAVAGVIVPGAVPRRMSDPLDDPTIPHTRHRRGSSVLAADPTVPPPRRRVSDPDKPQRQPKFFTFQLDRREHDSRVMAKMVQEQTEDLVTRTCPSKYRTLAVPDVKQLSVTPPSYSKRTDGTIRWLSRRPSLADASEAELNTAIVNDPLDAVNLAGACFCLRFWFCSVCSCCP